MKKIILFLGLLVGLSSCSYGGFQSRDSFERELARQNSAEKVHDFPKITYMPENGAEGDYQTSEIDEEDRLDFAAMYGSGKIGRNLDPATARGNLINTVMGDSQIGISLVPSIQIPGGYSTLLTYKRSEELVEREFGPVAGFVEATSVVTYDVVESESGPLLLVSLVSVRGNETYSAYFLFNRYMSLMDYLVFRNSTDNIMVTVERLGEVIEYTDRAYSGTIDDAIERRMQTERTYFDSLFGVYGIKYRPATALVASKEMDIGYIPDVEAANRILIAKTTSNPVNPGTYIDIE